MLFEIAQLKFSLVLKRAYLVSLFYTSLLILTIFIVSVDPFFAFILLPYVYMKYFKIFCSETRIFAGL